MIISWLFEYKMAYEKWVLGRKNHLIDKKHYGFIFLLKRVFLILFLSVKEWCCHEHLALVQLSMVEFVFLFCWIHWCWSSFHTFFSPDFYSFSRVWLYDTDYTEKNRVAISMMEGTPNNYFKSLGKLVILVFLVD